MKKSDLYSSLWSSCDELRGGMDASQYKDYVLTLLFVKYVSDKHAGQSDALIDVPEGGSFADMVAVKGDKEIGDKLNKIIGKLADANELRDVIDVADFNDDDKLGKGQEMQDRLSKLVAIFESLDFRANRNDGDDLLGDAYEYLMRHFATESGKSKGQFYTPAEVSRVMAKVVGINSSTRPDQAIYDPTCGSGSLLLKAADEAPRGITIYGQENDIATWALAKMNMILHAQPTAELLKGNTLALPLFKDRDGGLKTFDFVVANPPFSSKAWANGLDPLRDLFGRFDFGIPPAKNGDYAFLLHGIKSLKSTGKAAVILPHGVLFRGNREADIRRNLLKRGLIKSVIGLPANLFYGTGIPACIVVIDKENAGTRDGVFIIDASHGFTKDGNKNRLREQDIHKIIDVSIRQLSMPGYSRFVPADEIANADNQYNLNISRYIDSGEAEDVHDLGAHLQGGIPDRDIAALAGYWKVFPSLRSALFGHEIRPGYLQPKLDRSNVGDAISKNPEFEIYAAKVRAVIADWWTENRTILERLQEGVTARDVVRSLSESLLVRVEPLPLLDQYDVYQRFMDYWAEVMQDDIYLISTDGWHLAAQPRAVIEDKSRKVKESPDLIVGGRKLKIDLIPPHLLAAHYYLSDREAVEALEAAREIATQALSDFVEDNGSEEGALGDLRNEKGVVPKGSVRNRLRALQGDTESEDERGVLSICLRLIDEEAAATKEAREAAARLSAKVLDHYTRLTDSEIKGLVIDEKWFVAVSGLIASEVRDLAHRLARRVAELEERYATPLPEIEASAADRRAMVEAHLKEMGQVWA